MSSVAGSTGGAA